MKLVITIAAAAALAAASFFAMRPRPSLPTPRAALGDTVLIDFEGYSDGTKFDGGTAKNQQLELGSNRFIPGFEKQIVGHKRGDSFDVSVRFPDDYHHKPLAGKPAVFKVRLNEILRK
jgi:trigger factor